MSKGLPIESVAPNSPAEHAGILHGERLVSINGTNVRDIIDYSWLMMDEEPELLIESEDGSQRNLILDTFPGEPVGLSFPPPEPKRCANNCIFCFIHQLPRGLRRQLYVKDEDYRLSFLHGTYVTLTNLKPSELSRIIQQRLSPLYISVHTTDTDLREKMLGKKGIPPIMEQLRLLAASGIKMHTQIVLCPGINDGSHLKNTVMELASLHPYIQSLAIVPLGLTAHRKNLPALTAVDTAYAEQFLDAWLPEMRRINKSLGDAFLQIADEFFIKAGKAFPSLREYGDLPQWENGAGIVPCFLKEASSVLKKAKTLKRHVEATIVTGESAFGFISEFVASLAEKTSSLLHVVPVPNLLFGSSVTVTGLVTGADILASLKERNLGEALLLPDVMLKEGAELFLDDLSTDRLSAELGTRVLHFAPAPSDFYRLLVKLAGSKNKAQLKPERYSD